MTAREISAVVRAAMQAARAAVENESLPPSVRGSAVYALNTSDGWFEFLDLLDAYSKQVEAQ